MNHLDETLPVRMRAWAASHSGTPAEDRLLAALASGSFTAPPRSRRRLFASLATVALAAALLGGVIGIHALQVHPAPGPVHHPVPTAVVSPTPTVAPTSTPHPAVGPNIADAQLVDGDHGWALLQGPPQRLEWTANDGTTWTDITPPKARGAAVLGVFFRTSSDGWVVSSTNPSRPPTISDTTNSGHSWTSQVLPALTTQFGGYAGAHVAFVGGNDGWVVLDEGSDSSGTNQILYRTTDGGRNWLAANVPAPGAIYFMTANDGWLVGGPGPEQGMVGYGAPGAGFWVTHDGGETWHAQVLPAPPRYASDTETYMAPDTDLAASTVPIANATFSDPTTGDVVAIAFYTSRNNGASWSLSGLYAVPSPQGNAVAYQIIAATTWYLWAPGTTPAFLTTTDAGATWSSHTSPGGGTWGLSFGSAQDGWAAVGTGGCASFKSDCSQNTSLYGTKNAGSEWTILKP